MRLQRENMDGGGVEKRKLGLRWEREGLDWGWQEQMRSYC